MAKTIAANVNNVSGLAKVKNLPQNVKSFLADVRNEMRKVTSPSRKEVQATTTVVIITVFIFGIYFWVVDGVIGKSLDSAFRYFANR